MIYLIHKNDIHRGICSLREKIKEKLLFFDGLSFITDYCIKSCIICLKKIKNL